MSTGTSHLLASAADAMPRAAVGDRGHAPSGVRSPSRPSGRKTSTAIRIPNTIERVQSLPGAYQSEALVERLDEPDQQRAEHRAGEVPDPTEDGSRERDQAELEAGVVAHLELEEDRRARRRPRATRRSRT